MKSTSRSEYDAADAETAGVQPDFRRWRLCVAGCALIAACLTVPSCSDSGEDDARRRVDALLARLDRMALVVPRRADAIDDAFFVDRFEVTNERFLAFRRDSGYEPIDGDSFLRHLREPMERDVGDLMQYPVVFVSAADAEAFATAEGKQLPTQQQWSDVAAALSARGTAWASFIANVSQHDLRGPTRVGTFQSGRTRAASEVAPPVYDLVGNVAEWTKTAGVVADQRRVCGGSFAEKFLESDAFAASLREPPVEFVDDRNFALGFRCVIGDAKGLVRTLLADLAVVMPEDRARAFDALVPFGEPLRRVIDALRFESGTRDIVRAGSGDDDLVIPVEDGSVVVCAVSGSIRRFDPRSGAVLAQRDGFAEFYHAIACDVDRDGTSELLVGTNADPRDGKLDPTTWRLLFLDADRARLDLVRMDDFERTPLDEFVPDGLEAGLNAFGLPDETLLSARLLPRRLDRAERGLALGFVAQLSQDLVCLDAATLEERWRVRTPHSYGVAFAATRGEVWVPGHWWAFSADGVREWPRILDLRILRASDGKELRSGRAAGGAWSSALLSGESPRLLSVAGNGSLLESVIDDGRVRTNVLRSPSATGHVALQIRSGPAPAAASLLEANEAADAVALTTWRRDGDVMARRELPAPGPYDPRHFVPEGGDVLLLKDSTLGLQAFDARLRPRWSKDENFRAELDQVTPITVDWDGDGTSELVCSRGFDEWVVVDARHGSVVDRFVLPGTSLRRLIRGPREERGESIWAGYRDVGLFRLGKISGAEARIASELRDRVDPGEVAR
ncbi:MAG: SUMF1/EgtB/PvdO family nonheme iron enzyme [Planctomycetes bacterium]|nr:SUMF1/EgtB/PvdO family nonheme iron enzyme [Planctomycetota bacterium]